MADNGERDLEITKSIDAAVTDLERRSRETREEIAKLMKEGDLRAQIVHATRPDLVSELPRRFKPIEVSVAELPAQVKTDERAGQRTKNRLDSGSPKGSPKRVRHEEIVGWCRMILREEGREMKTREIHKRLVDNPEWRVPGAGTVSNVSAHLGQSAQFGKGTKPGTWRLVGEGES